jgi:Gpi18-like mannosyltransferase
LAGLWVWLASRLGLAAVTALSWIGEERPGLTVKTVAFKWAYQWDSTFFIGIARNGYIRTPDQSDAAFFPAYPMLIRALAPIFRSDWFAALVVANVALFALLVVLYRLAEQEFGAAPASRTIFYLVAYPTGFFLTAAYNEGLFLALLVGSVYCMRRGNWWVAALLGAFAASTRSAGILLMLPFCYEYLRQHGRRIRMDVLALGVIPLGLAAVMIVNKVTMNDPLAFSHSQTLHWGRQLNWPWVAIVDAFESLTSNRPYERPFTDIWVHNLLEFGTVILVLIMTALALVGPWRMRRDQLVFPLFALALTLFMVSFPSTFKGNIPYPLVSTSRIGLEVFPAFMMLGRLGRHPMMDRALLVSFLGMQGILVTHFLHSGWVA